MLTTRLRASVCSHANTREPREAARARPLSCLGASGALKFPFCNGRNYSGLMTNGFNTAAPFAAVRATAGARFHCVSRQPTCRRQSWRLLMCVCLVDMAKIFVVGLLLRLPGSFQ